MVLARRQADYEGKNPFLQKEPWCANCHSRPDAGLLLCSHCSTAWYCNKTCQKKHFRAHHKSICKDISKHLHSVKQEAQRLRKTPFGTDRARQNVFETQAGYFSQGEQTDHYMSARESLTQSYFDAALDVHIQSVWEKALFEALATFRLDVAADAEEIWFIIPYILLYLDRDDDVLAFIRHLTQVDAEQNMEELVRRHIESHEGEWIFPSEKDCRFLDIFEQRSNANDYSLPIHILVPLLLIKLRLVATYDSIKKAIEVVFETTGGQRIQVVRDRVTDMLMERSLQNLNIDAQREQIDHLMEVIDMVNPAVLPTMVDPDPLMDRFESQREMPAHLLEALENIPRCNPCFNRIPGARRVLARYLDRKKY
jgi:hypothetical protein